MSSPASRKPRIKVGVIGLGIIGTRVAANLRGAGHQVYVWSRSPHRAPNFLGSVVEVADLSDVIQVFVSDDAALLEVTRTIAAALSPRHLFASHATVSPEAARQAAAIIEGQGARYLDAPFTGSKAAALNRQLVYYVGGSQNALEEIRPVLEASSKRVVHVGKVGDASVLKIATNMITASTVQTLAEALALVRAAGVGDHQFVEALENNGSRSGTSDLKLPAMIAQNFEPNFSLKHMLKDARLALNLADALELSLPVTETTAEVLSLGMANGWADQDFCCVSQLYPVPEGTVRTDLAGAPDRPASSPPAVPSEEPTAASPKTVAPRGTAAIAAGPARPGTGFARVGIKQGAFQVLRGLFKPPASRQKAGTDREESAPAPVAAEPATPAEKPSGASDAAPEGSLQPPPMPPESSPVATTEH